MNAVFSHWAFGQADKAILNNFHFSFLLAKKHFGSVHLIANTQGANELSFLPFDSISTALDGLDSSKANLLSYGKINALGECGKLFDKFIYIDSDCFLWKKPKENILDAEIFSMCEDVVSSDLQKMRPSFSRYDGVIDNKTKWMPLMSICGGNNSTLWVDYCNIANQIIFDPEYQQFWNSDIGPQFGRALISLQWILAAMLSKIGKPMKFMFPNEESPLSYYCLMSAKDCEMAGISRLGLEQKGEKFARLIEERLSKNPPDLAMKTGLKASDMLVNFGTAMINYAADGFKNASKEKVADRLSICKGCEYWDGLGYFGIGKCRKCGCSGAKLFIESSTCPIGKW